MSDTIQLPDSVRQQIGHLAETFANANVPITFKNDMTEEEVIAMCVYFTQLVLSMGIPIMMPLSLIALKGAHELATETGDATELATLRQLMLRK